MKSNWGMDSDRWDAVLMRYFGGREGEPPWFMIAPARRERLAYWGLKPEELPPEDAPEYDWKQDDPDGYEAPWE